MNSTLVPDGSTVTVSISSIQMEPQKAVSNGKFNTTIRDLKPESQYDYNITFFRNDSGAIIDRPIYGRFITVTAQKSKCCKLLIYIIILIILFAIDNCKSKLIIAIIVSCVTVVIIIVIMISISGIICYCRKSK
jgi:hypothetical protein